MGGDASPPAPPNRRLRRRHRPGQAHCVPWRSSAALPWGARPFEWCPGRRPGQWQRRHGSWRRDDV